MIGFLHLFRNNHHYFLLIFFISAGEAPAIKKEMQDVTTKLGEAAQLTCQIVGRPLPDIKWYRFGKELVQSRKYKMSSDGRNHTLTVMTDEQEDEGLYTCMATNDVGEIETSGKLLLQAPPQFHPGFPLKEKYYAGAGGTLRLHVVYIGRPVPAITWFHGNNQLSSGTDRAKKSCQMGKRSRYRNSREDITSWSSRM
uniref:Ig-like domain-containing protein n=1 Tax=Zonotrichia albicollis TaxID=44394 RepID=A0A8D2NF46_ZONAL